MNVTDHINRLRWRFQTGVAFKPNQTDLDALNGIIEWVNNQREKTIKENHLFAKLYIYYLDVFIRHHETDIFDLTPQKELSRMLEKPLETFYEAFRVSMNDNTRHEILRAKGVSIDVHPKLRNEDLQNDVTIEDFKDTWDIETVTDNLNAMITEAVNRFG